MKVDIFHNILWSKYKGGVFSKLNEIASESKFKINFVQIAETEGDRIGLSNVDLSYHRYPYHLLHKGTYESIAPWTLCYELFSMTMKSDADLIVIPGYHRIEYWAQLLACFLSSKKSAVFCDSTAFDKPSTFAKNIAKRIFFRIVDGFFAYGIRSKQYICSYGVGNERVFFRCQAAALPHDYNQQAALAKRIANAPLKNEPRYLYAGRLSHEKDLHVLLQAMALVLTEKPASKLIIVGSGILKDELIELANRLSISHAVEFTGSMDIPALALEYAKASCFVLPSNSEPWGLVINEALSYGCPVVVSHSCGCVPELVIDGITGYEFPTGDIKLLAEKLLAMPDEFSDIPRVAETCIAHISKFSPENAANQILTGIEKIINHP